MVSLLTTKTKAGYVPDDNLLNIVKEVGNVLDDVHDMPTTVRQLLAKSKSINTEGGGHCNTITLYYVSLRSQNEFKDVKSNFTASHLKLSKIKQLNETIISKKLIEK